AAPDHPGPAGRPARVATSHHRRPARRRGAAPRRRRRREEGPVRTTSSTSGPRSGAGARALGWSKAKAAGALACAIVLAAAAAASGRVLPSQSATPGAEQAPVVGRILSVCTAPDDTTARLAAVVSGHADDGSLTATPLGGSDPAFRLDRPGSA